MTNLSPDFIRYRTYQLNKVARFIAKARAARLEGKPGRAAAYLYIAAVARDTYLKDRQTQH